jgi:hypothetical protein
MLIIQQAVDILVHKVASRYPTLFFHSPSYPLPITDCGCTQSLTRSYSQ